MSESLASLLAEVRACRLCAGKIPEPNPVLSASADASLLIVGQAPGIRVHNSGIPWNDPSGDRLRRWMDVSTETFYDNRRIAIMPMGFCFPGKGKSGDLPPRPECALTWHERLQQCLPAIRCTLLIGQFAQNYYLDEKYPSLTERVRDWRRFAPGTYVLPHPSPRNLLWLRRNPWFEQEVVPELRATLHSILG